MQVSRHKTVEKEREQEAIEKRAARLYSTNFPIPHVVNTRNTSKGLWFTKELIWKHKNKHFKLYGKIHCSLSPNSPQTHTHLHSQPHWLSFMLLPIELPLRMEGWYNGLWAQAPKNYYAPEKFPQQKERRWKTNRKWTPKLNLGRKEKNRPLNWKSKSDRNWINSMKSLSG